MNRVYIHPLPVRIWHWTNAACFVLLILTGLQLRYHDLVHAVSFEAAVRLHNYLGFAAMGSYLLWLLYYVFSDKNRNYHAELNPMKFYADTIRQAAYYGYGIFRGAPNPHHTTAYTKFNPMQKMAYQVIMLLVVPLQFATGVLLWDAGRFARTVDALGGVRVVDTVHVLLCIFFSAFIVVHFYLATLGHTASAHFKAMVTGYEELEGGHGPGAR